MDPATDGWGGQTNNDFPNKCNKAAETDAGMNVLSRTTESWSLKQAVLNCSRGSEKASPGTRCCRCHVKDEQSWLGKGKKEHSQLRKLNRQNPEAGTEKRKCQGLTGQ